MATKKINGRTFEIPQHSIYCEKCGSTNFIYNDLKPPYLCADCAAPLDVKDLTEADLSELQYEHEEGKYSDI